MCVCVCWIYMYIVVMRKIWYFLNYISLKKIIVNINIKVFVMRFKDFGVLSVLYK